MLDSIVVKSGSETISPVNSSLRSLCCLRESLMFRLPESPKEERRGVGGVGVMFALNLLVGA